MTLQCYEHSDKKASDTDHEPVKKSSRKACLKCNEQDGALLCSNDDCPIVVHKECMSCAVHFDGEGNFYCPYCAYKRSLGEYHKAKECAISAKKALASFMNMKTVSSTGDVQTDVSGFTFREDVLQNGSSMKIEVSKKPGEIGGSHSGRVSEVKNDIKSLNDDLNLVTDSVIPVRLNSDSLKHQKIAVEVGVQRKQTQREPNGSRVCSARNDAMDINRSSDKRDAAVSKKLGEIVESHSERVIEGTNDLNLVTDNVIPVRLNSDSLKRQKIAVEVGVRRKQTQREPNGSSVCSARNEVMDIDRSSDKTDAAVSKKLGEIGGSHSERVIEGKNDLNLVTDNVIPVRLNSDSLKRQKTAVEMGVQRKRAQRETNVSSVCSARNDSMVIDGSSNKTDAAVSKKLGEIGGSHSERVIKEKIDLKSLDDDLNPAMDNVIPVRLNSDSLKRQKTTVELGLQRKQTRREPNGSSVCSARNDAMDIDGSSDKTEAAKLQDEYTSPELLKANLEDPLSDEIQRGQCVDAKTVVRSPKNNACHAGNHDASATRKESEIFLEKDIEATQVKSRQKVDPLKQTQHHHPSVYVGRRKKLPWTKEEEEMLKEGVDKFSLIAKKNMPWVKILEHGSHVFDGTRTPDDLKDKWKRILSKAHANATAT